jgi:hypothetical protein
MVDKRFTIPAPRDFSVIAVTFQDDVTEWFRVHVGEYSFQCTPAAAAQLQLCLQRGIELCRDRAAEKLQNDIRNAFPDSRYPDAT